MRLANTSPGAQPSPETLRILSELIVKLREIAARVRNGGPWDEAFDADVGATSLQPAGAGGQS